MKYLITGLGNPGAEYYGNRHNIGFLVMDALARSRNEEFQPAKHGYTATIKHKGRTLLLLKPTTFMNLSGKAVRHHLGENKIRQQNLLVVTDDLSLPTGKLRMRAKGSAGGHNGLKNIEEILGSNQYSRLRFGVGDNFSKGRQVDYVLSDFPPDETAIVEEGIDKAILAILDFVALGVNRAMTDHNKK